MSGTTVTMPMQEYLDMQQQIERLKNRVKEERSNHIGCFTKYSLTGKVEATVNLAAIEEHIKKTSSPNEVSVYFVKEEGESNG